jgi:anti-sigma factor RsiW
MSAAREAGECRRFERWLTAYVDSELDAVHALEVEDHLASCQGCQELVAFNEATRNSLRTECKMLASAGLRERIAASLRTVHASTIADEESQPGDSLDASALPLAEPVAEAPSPRHAAAAPLAVPTEAAVRTAPAEASPLGRMRYMLPVAAAATFALLIGAMRLQQPSHSDAIASGSPSGVQYAGTSLDGLIEDLVLKHAHPPPPETTDPNGLERFDPYIGVRVRQPRFDKVEATYVGARMMDERAAMLQYVLRNRHRVTMYVFDPRKVSSSSSTGRLERRQFGSQSVLMGRVRGYSVAASENGGVGYALASDLPDDESAKLLVMAAK